MWNAGAVALTAALTIVSVHQATRWALVHSLDELLLEDAEEVRLALNDLRYEESNFRNELNRKAIGHRRHEWFVKLLDEQGRVIWGSVNAPAQTLPPVVGLANQFADSGAFRHFTSPVKDDSAIRWIRVGASMQPLALELGRIDRIAFITWLLSLGIAPLMGWYLSGGALRPLRLMVQTAASLQPDDLTERLPNRGAADELDQLAVTVNTLLDRIATDIREKHDFLANAAHELRTPLAAIRTTADVALVTDRSGEEYRELLAQMMEQTDNLSVVVNQLLLLSESSLPSRPRIRTAFQLNEIVAKAAEILKVVAESSDVTLTVERNESIEVIGNRDQWIQVLNNLIGNAIKYTPSGGRIVVELERIPNEQDGDVARLRICDTGIGIHPSDVNRVFERFFRASQSPTRLSEVTGTGLGLSICQVVVEGHGGTITCESELGQGTCFTILLPLAPLFKDVGVVHP
jgi:two-component system, OmpR family, heavy metal sensor histidine kinase CusS